MDQDQLTEIYDTYQRPIYRSIYRQVGDVETARDLTADVFQRLLQAVQKGKAPSLNLKAWLYRTAHNIVVDYYRRGQFRNHDPLLKDYAAEGPDPSQTAETQMQIDSVRAALNTLTPDQRQVITLKFLEGLSNDEAALIMGKSCGAIKSLQHRALAALQREMFATNDRQNSMNQPAPTPKKEVEPAGSTSVIHQPLLNASSQ